MGARFSPSRFLAEGPFQRLRCLQKITRLVGRSRASKEALPHPVDIADPKIAKAYAHPLRIEIMTLLENRVASPRQLATELDASLPTVSYHVRQLLSLKLVKLVKRRQKRGSIEHFYTAAVRPRMYDEVWSRVPRVAKRAIVGSRLSQLGQEVFAAAEAGGFDREDVHLTRTRMTLTREGWEEVGKHLADLLERLDQIKARDAHRLEQEPDTAAVEATAVLMLFEAAIPATLEGSTPSSVASADELDDVQPTR